MNDKIARPDQVKSDECSHLDSIREITPNSSGCEDCLKMGDQWVNLRVCLTCGYVGCCDNSRNKHASKHFHATQHPIIQTLEPWEEWLWCYVDKVLIIP